MYNATLKNGHPSPLRGVSQFDMLMEEIERDGSSAGFPKMFDEFLWTKGVAKFDGEDILGFPKIGIPGYLQSSFIYR